jgi:histidine phosphotransferase ChpT
MGQSIDARLLELISARLCHDLVGPVSAIGNGVELVTEFGEDMRGEALALIAQSASEAAHRLQFFRIAFGSAAGADGRGLPVAEGRARALALPLGGRISVDWPSAVPGVELERAELKLLLNLYVVAVDVAVGNGTVRVRVPGDKDGERFSITVEGAKAALSDEVKRALDGQLNTDMATPRTAIAVYAGVLANEAKIVIQSIVEVGRVRLAGQRIKS